MLPRKRHFIQAAPNNLIMKLYMMNLLFIKCLGSAHEFDFSNRLKFKNEYDCDQSASNSSNLSKRMNPLCFELGCQRLT